MTRTSPLLLVLTAFTLLTAGGCGPDPSLARTQVRLALDFGADEVLELFVVDEATATCGDLLSGTDPNGDGVTVHAVDRTPANALNNGGSFASELDELPADVPLAFYARATNLGDLRAQACEANVMVPANGTVEVTLVVDEP